jgi:peptidoglycan/LPS O-acetylase OafA/YrhL
MISFNTNDQQHSKIASLMNNSRHSLKLLAVATLGILSGGSVAEAHPGHSLFDATPMHLLTSPDHFLVLAMAGTVLLFGAKFIQRRLPRRLIQGAGVVALAGAAVVWSSLI